MEDSPNSMKSPNNGDSLAEFKTQVQGAVESLRHLQGSKRVDAMCYIQGVLQMLGPQLNLQRIQSSQEQSSASQARMVMVASNPAMPNGTAEGMVAVPGTVGPRRVSVSADSPTLTRMEERVARLEAALGHLQSENHRLQAQLKSSQSADILRKENESTLMDHALQRRSTDHESSSLVKGDGGVHVLNPSIDVLSLPVDGLVQVEVCDENNSTSLTTIETNNRQHVQTEARQKQVVLPISAVQTENAPGNMASVAMTSKASFTTEVTPSLAKPPLNGVLAKFGVTSSVNEALGDQFSGCDTSKSNAGECNVVTDSSASDSRTAEIRCGDNSIDPIGREPSDTSELEEVKKEKKKRGPLGPQKKTVRHICHLCTREFTHGRPFHRHLEQHGVHCPVSCRQCRREFWNLPLLQHHHCQPQKDRQPHRCPHCQSSFSNAKKRNAHVRLVHHGKSIARHFCPECGQGYVKKETLRRHMQEHAGVNQVCQKCGKTFAPGDDFFEHMAWHERNAPYVCPKCDMHISKQHCYLKHLAAHDLYDCSHCSSRFTQRRHLQSHLLEKHDIQMADNSGSTDGVTASPVTAPQPQSFPSPTAESMENRGEQDMNSLMDHDPGFDDNDPGDDDVDDPVSPPSPDPPSASQQGVSKGNRITPMSTEEQPPVLEPIYKCDLCDRLFRRKASLEKHKKTFRHQRRQGVTSFPQNHLCPRCGKSYHRRQDLQRHLRYHNEERPHACPHCPYRCQEQANLRRHLALHFSQRQFMCHLCAAAFHCKKSLQTHVLFKHTDQRNFSCPECSSSFKTQNSLQRHMKVHSKVRSHKCDSCGAAFHRLYNLRRHMKSVHGTDERLPPIKRVKLLDAPAGQEFVKGAALMERLKPATRTEPSVSNTANAVPHAGRVNGPEQTTRVTTASEVTNSIPGPSIAVSAPMTAVLTELTSVPVCCTIPIQPSPPLTSHANVSKVQTRLVDHSSVQSSNHRLTSHLKLDTSNQLTLTFKPPNNTPDSQESLITLTPLTTHTYFNNLEAFQSAPAPPTSTNHIPFQPIPAPPNNTKIMSFQQTNTVTDNANNEPFQADNTRPTNSNAVPFQQTNAPPGNSQMQSLLQQCYLSLAETSSGDSSGARLDSDIYAAVPGLLQLMQGNT